MNEHYQIKMPDYPSIETLSEIESAGSFWDSLEMDDMNNTLIRTSLQLKAINAEINKYDRLKTQAEMNYKHNMRENILKSTAKTETQKKMMAEVLCEDLEIKVVYYDEILRELSRQASSLRNDLDILKTVSYNLRQEMKI